MEGVDAHFRCGRYQRKPAKQNGCEEIFSPIHLQCENKELGFAPGAGVFLDVEARVAHLVGQALDSGSVPSNKYQQRLTAMETPEAKYAEFQVKVKRTVYLDNLSPQVNEAVIRTALDQFGNVVKVDLIPNFIGPKNIPAAALVEMENSKQAKQIIMEIDNFPFMMSGMPRPVRASAAEMEMFDDRPREPGRRITCRWLAKEDPDFEVAKRIKEVTRKHASEASFLLQQQLKEEERLQQRQAETLKANYKKFELIDKVLSDGTAKKLGSCYNMSLQDN